jgi:hypothetical protein
LQCQALFDVQREADAGRGEGQPPQRGADLGGFAAGVGAGEGGAAGGEIGEEPAHGDGGADGTTGGLVFEHAAAAHGQAPAAAAPGGGEKVELSDPGDAGQGLAAEAEGAHGGESPGGVLAGSVALAGQPQLGGSDAAPVVVDADQIEPAAADIDADGFGPGIERIFDQLFDDGGGALDGLAGGDAGGDAGGEDADGSLGTGDRFAGKSIALAPEQWRRGGGTAGSVVGFHGAIRGTRVVARRSSQSGAGCGRRGGRTIARMNAPGLDRRARNAVGLAVYCARLRWITLRSQCVVLTRPRILDQHRPHARQSVAPCFNRPNSM